MRILMLATAVGLYSNLSAHSQVADAPTSPQDGLPIYFVVDASGSMTGQNQADAELLLRSLSLPRTQLVSVTYFGGKPSTPGANLCFEELAVPQPVPRGNDFAPVFGELGGKDDQTAITNAIDNVLEQIGAPAKLIVITDGQEGCNRNFGDIWNRHASAEIEIEIRQVGDAPNIELEKLEEGPPRQPPVAALPSPPPPPPPPPTPPPTFQVLGSDSWLWILTLFLFVAASLAFSFHYGNAASKLEHKINKYVPPAKTEGDDSAKQ